MNAILRAGLIIKDSVRRFIGAERIPAGESGRLYEHKPFSIDVQSYAENVIGVSHPDK